MGAPPLVRDLSVHLLGLLVHLRVYFVLVECLDHLSDERLLCSIVLNLELVEEREGVLIAKIELSNHLFGLDHVLDHEILLLRLKFCHFKIVECFGLLFRTLVHNLLAR